MTYQFSLTVERVKPIWNPSASQIEESLESIRATGPYFVILEEAGGRYIQVAGDRSRLTAEFRDVFVDGFKHYVLGFTGEDRSKSKIATPGGFIACQRNEVMTSRDILPAFLEFRASTSIPATYELRDVTAQFAKAPYVSAQNDRK